MTNLTRRAILGKLGMATAGIAAAAVATTSTAQAGPDISGAIDKLRRALHIGEDAGTFDLNRARIATGLPPDPRFTPKKAKWRVDEALVREALADLETLTA